MRRRLVQLALALFALLVVGYPLAVWYGRTTFASGHLLLGQLFPPLGLLAVTLMYLHIIGRAFLDRVTPYVPFRLFERLTAYVVLVSMLLHGVLRTAYLVIEDMPLLPPPAYQLPLGLGLLGLLMLLTYDFGRAFIRSPWVARHWPTIDLISTLGFYVIWIHALLIGTELQEGLLRYVWIAYGLTAAGASLYTFWLRQEPSR